MVDWKNRICRGIKTRRKGTAGTNTTQHFWTCISNVGSYRHGKRAKMSKMVGSCQHSSMKYCQQKDTLVETMQHCMSVVVLAVLLLAMPSHICHVPPESDFWHFLPFGFHQQVPFECEYCMQFLP